MNRQLMLKTLLIFIAFGAINTSAATLEASPRLSGVIEDVNFRKKTIVIINDDTGRKETYRFDGETKISVDTNEINKQKTLRPGLTVRLIFPENNKLSTSGL